MSNRISRGDTLIFLFVLMAFVMALSLMWRFSNVLNESSQTRSSGWDVTVTNQTETVSHHVATESAISAYIKAETSLKNHFDSWMSILGLFGVAFGLLVPFASYLIQHRSLTEERDRIREDLDELRGLKKEVEDVKSRQVKLQGAFDQTNQPFWAALERCFEYSVISHPLASGMYSIPREYQIANLLLSMELMLDASVLSADAKLLKEKIGMCKLIVSKLMGEAPIWERACEIVRTGDERTSLVTGFHYLRLLNSDSQEYKWLKTFFEEIVPGKLP